MAQDIGITELLRSEGFDSPQALGRARSVLEQAGLTRPGKERISREKLAGARRLLAAALLRVCDNDECVRLARAGAPAREAGTAAPAREPVTVPPAACEVCAGSNNRRAARALARRLNAAGLGRILVVGGTPVQHSELQQLLAGDGVQVRCVDGAVGSHSKRDAAPNLRWAQLLVVWGATTLPHKVSKLYTDDPPPHVRRVPLAKRGVEALCREVLRSLA